MQEEEDEREQRRRQGGGETAEEDFLRNLHGSTVPTSVCNEPLLGNTTCSLLLSSMNSATADVSG